MIRLRPAIKGVMEEIKVKGAAAARKGLVEANKIAVALVEKVTVKEHAVAEAREAKVVRKEVLGASNRRRGIKVKGKGVRALPVSGRITGHVRIPKGPSTAWISMLRDSVLGGKPVLSRTNAQSCPPRDMCVISWATPKTSVNN